MLFRTPTPPSARARFGRRLRYWREARGLSQAELGRRLGYDDSLISRVENARRWPPPGLPARADELLLTHGELTAIWPLVEQERQRLAQLAGPARATLATPGRPAAATVEALEQLLTAYRAAASAIGGRDLVGVLEYHTRTLAGWQREAPRATLGPLLNLTARYAELAGWARFDNADHAQALGWYDYGHDLAARAGDRATAATLLARRSSVHWSRAEAGAAVELARAARAAADGLPGVQAWAALAQARGHALAGEQPAVRRALEEASRLAGTAAQAGEPTPWLREADAVLSVAYGTCHRDLAVRTGHRGVARLAATQLRAATTRLDRPALLHDLALVTARLAGAYVWAGEPEAAAATLAELPPDAAGRVAQEAGQARGWLARRTTRGAARRPARRAPLAAAT
ncbi:helix-turn-helix domain-containing protein [Kitasatospora sp. NPDC050543]|uniref:helix-turn-helix domain-containing protein n=1 Tax=Kitasatospora sp. NPDC050543 TaxID=3364054 RepID=UPI0037953F59